ncbi:NACHT domain-containing protein [Desmonostoc muscorum LEGE 12446]|uniref:NACHT domain-containing protein n=1 Tax=Desmonostoc muscorum LEGE 12446 TaxID=1828758 RepID=A0A8J6ZR35_DESMC|nr:NACHT domain-containing protein [Desmonostoc muscorum]MCF2148810.1 NACHT domain-containing protein [Desmonostoc muscorum LEGE 12446]
MAAIEVNQQVFNELKQAYSEKFGGSLKDLMSKLDLQSPYPLAEHEHLISERTIRNFFNTLPTPKTQEKNLNYLCTVLLKECTSYQQAVKKFAPGTASRFVQQSWLDSYLEHLIKECNTVKVLSMREPISLDDIFIKVNIIESIKGQRAKSIQELEDNSLDCNRFGQIVHQKGVPGLDVVKKHQRLMIWGMAGAGKTTFLKYIAMHGFTEQEDTSEKPLPFFISLKKFAESENRQSLFNCILQEFAQWIPEQLKHIRSDVDQLIIDYLDKGKCLILLDGLDEVLARDTDDVHKSIEDFNKRYSKNYMIITCRHAACEYNFQKFVEVEIADFDDQEIEAFINKWFSKSPNQDKLENFLRRLNENPSIKQLAKNPLLLTLLCLVAGDDYDLPINRYQLYQDAVEVLLKRWDTSRKIQHDTTSSYKLSRHLKINILGEIAYDAFIQKPQKYLWHKFELGAKISKYIENIDGFEPHKLHDDSQLFLKSLEMHHGLIAEQAQGIYAFSHLTFQEYFTAQYIYESRVPGLLNQILKQHLTDSHWREVFVILACRFPKADADDFIKLIFYYANELVKSDELQKMLKWLYKLTTKTLELSSSSWRALYLTIDLDTDLYINNEINIDRNTAESLSIKLREINTKYNKIIHRNYKDLVTKNLSVIHNFASDKASNKSWKIYESSKFIQNRLEVDENFTLESKLQETINIATENSNVNLADALKFLQSRQPSNRNSTSEWQQWADDLQNVMLEQLDIGYDVQFSEEDTKALDNYLYVSNLLLDCIQESRYTIKGLREELIDNLLLPKEQIPPHLFGDGVSNVLAQD